MRRQSIFIQPPHDCFYNRSLYNVTTSSDICVLQEVGFDISGATKIMTGITTGSTGVYILPSSAKTIDLTFNFTGDVTPFTAQSASFKYEIYKRNNRDIFSIPPIISKGPFLYGSTTGITGNTLIQNIEVNDLNLDGDYLIKGYFEIDVCTTFLNKLGVKVDTSENKIGSEYGIYRPSSDFYFIAFKQADKPNLTNSVDTGPAGNLVGYTILPKEEGQTIFTVNALIRGAVIVNLNGLTLVDKTEYLYDSITSTITLSEPTKLSDVITIFFVSNQTTTQTLNNDTIVAPNPIVSGNVNTQGNNSIFYNVDESKYEVYTNIEVIGTLILSLNGVTLANGVDYYQSTSNPKRWILNGIILPDDIITLNYNGSTNVVNDVTNRIQTFNWNIENAPINDNGLFTVQISNKNDTGFTNTIFSGTTNYQKGINSYSLNLPLSGDNGDELIYRVCNEKKYTTIAGDELKSLAYSEVIPIKISTNSFNSY